MEFAQTRQTTPQTVCQFRPVPMALPDPDRINLLADHNSEFSVNNRGIGTVLFIYVELGGDPETVIRLYSSKLADATQSLVVWLANELCSEGLLDTQTRDDLLSIDGISSYNKAVQLWSQIRVIVRVQENPRRALLTVCNVMKQRAELKSLAQAMILQLMPHGKNFVPILTQHRYRTCIKTEQTELHETENTSNDQKMSQEIALELQPLETPAVNNSSQSV